MKYFMIAIDGPDRAGKTSLIQEIHKQSKYRHIIVDRAILSNIAYNIIYKRNLSNENYWRLFKKFTLAGLITVFLTADRSVLEQRYLATNEKDLDIEDYEKHLKTWNFVYCLARMVSKKRVIKIDSSNQSSEQCAKEVLKHLGEL